VLTQLSIQLVSSKGRGGKGLHAGYPRGRVKVMRNIEGHFSTLVWFRFMGGLLKTELERKHCAKPGGETVVRKGGESYMGKLMLPQPVLKTHGRRHLRGGTDSEFESFKKYDEVITGRYMAEGSRRRQG